MDRDFYTDRERAQIRKTLAAAIYAAAQPPSTLPAWRWCEENITLDNTGPIPGKYDTRLTPMVRWVFDAAQNPRVRRVVVMVSAQSAKTQLAINHIAWAIAEDPGPSMWVMANQDHCEEFAKKRLYPAVYDCPKTAPLVPSERSRRNKRLIQFTTMNLMLRGSNSRQGLQSDPVRRIYCDERREWKPGAIDLLRKRTRTFHNSTEISLGTAGNANDALHQDFMEGSRTEPHFKCPHCGASQPFRFGKLPTLIYQEGREKGGLVWETSEETKPGGRWDEEKVKASVRLECDGCGHLFKNGDKFALIQTLHPVDYNPAAARHIRSFHWNALSMPWPTCDWSEIAWEFLRAQEAAARGNIEPLKAFITETLGEPWEDHLGVIDDFGFLDHRRGEYAFGDVWPDEKIRFMAADRQMKGGEHYYWAIRAYGPAGASRLIAYGRCPTTEDLEAIRKQYRVLASNCVMDSGDHAAAVYRFCAASGWRAFKGDSVPFYTHHETLPGGVTRPVRRVWTFTWQDPGLGTQFKGKRTLKLFRWANDPTKDLLAEYMRGMAGDWTIPQVTGRDFLEQITAEQRVEVADSFGRIRYIWKRVRKDNHWFDCECMIHVAALISKTIVEPVRQPAPERDNR